MFKNGNYWNGNCTDRSNDWVDHCKWIDQQTQRQVAEAKDMLERNNVSSVNSEELYPIYERSYGGDDIPMSLNIVFFGVFILFGGPIRAVASLIFIWWLFSG